jgi:hypothetical protein
MTETVTRASPRVTRARPRPAIPSVGEVKTWIEEIEVLKAEFERWLATRNQDGQ